MAGRRYRDDKKPYKANSYIAQLNHNRAMQAYPLTVTMFTMSAELLRTGIIPGEI